MQNTVLILNGIYVQPKLWNHLVIWNSVENKDRLGAIMYQSSDLQTVLLWINAQLSIVYKSELWYIMAPNLS